MVRTPDFREFPWIRALVAALILTIAFPPPRLAMGQTDTAGGQRNSRDGGQKLYQLLYDYHFTEPLSTLGQKVRILIWVRYMGFSRAQKRLLLNLAQRYQKRQQTVTREREVIIRHYEEQLEPIYREIHQAIAVPEPDEARLGELARQLESSQLAFKREDELHSLNIQMVRAVLSEERDFLNTLRPQQEEKLVTSLFFLREQLDPFAHPGAYRSIIGPTWNAGDFSSLVRKTNPKESHLNIGGLWGIDLESSERYDYANVRRSAILFFVMKEPALEAALLESLGEAPQPSHGQPSHGQPSHGQPAREPPVHGQPLHKQPVPGQPLHGQPAPGQPLHGQPAPGQPLHGQPAPGQPLHEQPAPGQPLHEQPAPRQPLQGQPPHTQPAPPIQ